MLGYYFIDIEFLAHDDPTFQYFNKSGYELRVLVIDLQKRFLVLMIPVDIFFVD